MAVGQVAIEGFLFGNGVGFRVDGDLACQANNAGNKSLSHDNREKLHFVVI